MTELFAAYTPNSAPHADGRTDHGYQLNVVDQDMAVVATVDLPHWQTFRPEEAARHLADAGYTHTGDFSPAGLGYMAPVTRIQPDAARP